MAKNISGSSTTKTGSRKFKLEDAERGLNLQMLLYLFAAEKAGAFAGATPAGILYMPAGAKTPEFGRDEGGSEKSVSCIG